MTLVLIFAGLYFHEIHEAVFITRIIVAKISCFTHPVCKYIAYVTNTHSQVTSRKKMQITYPSGHL